MGTESSNYVRGDMDIEEHAHTFGGFMGLTKYGGAAVALIVIYPTLVFGTPLSWFAALIVTLVVGVVVGLGLKLKGGWYAGMIAGAIPFAIFSAFLSKFVAGIA